MALVEAFVQSSPQVVYSGKRCQLNDLTCRSLADVPWDGLFRGDAPGCPRFYLFLGSSFGQATRPIALGKLSWSRQSLGSLSTLLPSRLRCRLVRPDRRGSLQVVYLPRSLLRCPFRVPQANCPQKYLLSRTRPSPPPVEGSRVSPSRQGGCNRHLRRARTTRSPVR